MAKTLKGPEEASDGPTTKRLSAKDRKQLEREKEEDRAKEMKKSAALDACIKKMNKEPGQAFRDEHLQPADARHPHPHLIIEDRFRLDNEAMDEIRRVEACGREVEALLNRQSLRRITRNPPVVDFCTTDGKIAARLVKGCVPPHLAELFETLHEVFDAAAVGWNLGCEADGSKDRIGAAQSMLKDRSKMVEAYGLNDGCTILGVGLKSLKSKEAGTLGLTYRNSEGKKIKGFQIGTYLNRQHLDKPKFISKVRELGFAEEHHKCQPLLDYLESLYRENAVDFLAHSQGWPKDMATLYMKHCTVERFGVKLNQRSRMSIHCDIGSPVPAAAFGPGCQRLVEGQWKEVCRGGRLFMLNGMFPLEYGPMDAAYFDGNEPHGPTSLKALNKEEARDSGSNGGATLERFSVVMAVRHRLDEKKGKTYKQGNYSGKWKKEWRFKIEAMAGIHDKRRLRSQGNQSRKSKRLRTK